MRTSLVKRINLKTRENIRNKIMISLVILTILMMLYTSFISYQLASDQIIDVNLRLSESNTSSAVSALDKELAKISDWSVQFVSIPEMQTLAKESASFSHEDTLMDSLEEQIISLRSSASAADISFASISVFLKNGYSHSTYSNYTLPFDTYDHCIEYFQSDHLSLSDRYTTPQWLLCTVDKNGKSVPLLFFLRFIYQPGTLEKLGVIAFGFEESWFSGLYDSYAPDARIVTKDGIIYSASGKNDLIGTYYQESDNLLQLLRSKSSNSTANSFSYKVSSNEEAIISFQSLREMRAYMVVPFDYYEEISTSEGHRYIQSTFIMFIVGLIIACCLSYIISHSISRSISSLTNFIKRVEQGESQLRYDPQGVDEISYLGKQFNTVLDKLQASAQQRENDLKANQALELQLNQLLINPHLLYNTLDSALWLISQDDSESATSLIQSMSEFFKLSLSHGNTKIPLKKELLLITHYLSIQKLARQKDIHIEFDIDENLYLHPMIKLTLQPLVENAVVHGFSGYRDDGTIQISAKRNENSVDITVRDNGIGMLPEEVEEINRVLQLPMLPNDYPHFGLFNINRRIIQTFGDQYGLSIHSEVSSHTAITMHLPYLLDKAHE